MNVCCMECVLHGMLLILEQLLIRICLRTMAFDCLIDVFDGFVRDNRQKNWRREEELKTPARSLELTCDSESIGADQTTPADADDAFAGDPQPICLSPRPSPEVDPP